MQVIAQHIPPSIVGQWKCTNPNSTWAKMGEAAEIQTLWTLSKQMRAPPAKPLVSTTRPRSQSIP